MKHAQPPEDDAQYIGAGLQKLQIKWRLSLPKGKRDALHNFCEVYATKNKILSRHNDTSWKLALNWTGL